MKVLDMQDLIVPLFKLPQPNFGTSTIEIRPVFQAELKQTAGWVRQRFGDGWANEFEFAARLDPVSSYVALQDKSMLGFACNHAAAKGVFGPTGVSESARGKGIGKQLLFRALTDMRAQGFAYAIIGGVGPIEYYKQIVGALEIGDGEMSFLNTILPKTSPNR